MATEILRPNAAGDENALLHKGGGSGNVNNWQEVDEVIADEGGTYVVKVGTGYLRDLYELPAHSVGSGTINSITIYFRISCFEAAGIVYGKPAQKSGATITEGTQQSEPGTDWSTKSQTYTTNPATTNAYTWAEIDALQIGVALNTSSSTRTGGCTQVYVEVDYTPAPAGWTGKLSGVSSPAKIAGVVRANIAKVKGVA